MFASLRLFLDPTPHAAPLNMAIDEALLALPVPTLRFYGWARNSVSIGYFTPLESVSKMEDCEIVRRWTGGGIVHHDGLEITYALAAPASEPATRQRSAPLYCGIHRALVGTLGEMGIQATLAQPSEGSAASSACFERPVSDDVLDAAGLKLAGAAQRRSRAGFLQQGSIRLTPERKTIELLATGFARRLAAEVVIEEPSLEPGQLADLEGKYRSPEWLRRF